MKFGFPALAVALGTAFLVSSCGHKLQTREAVERGVLKGVGQRGVNVDAMDVNVTKVNFHGDKADAVVAFTPKGGKLSDGLTMRYTLQQQGNEWVIIGRSQMDVRQHAGAPLPDQDPNAGSLNQPGTSLPPGHPPVDRKAQ